MTYGNLPVTVDHKDGVKDNNKINNLRAATALEQQRNKPPSKNNTSGYKGVCWHTTMNK